MKRFFTRFFNATVFPVITWFVTGLVCLTILFCASWIETTLPVQMILFGSLLGAGALVSVLLLAAWIRALCQKNWKRALFQLLLGGGAAVILGGVAGGFIIINLIGGYRKWTAAEVQVAESPLPFTVEYRHAHPFLAEYHKRIRFSSGKTIGIWMDTGGAGPFAIYRLPTGHYYLVDGLDFQFVRNDYRIDPERESVEMLCADTWVQIPDGAQNVNGKGGASLTAETSDGEVTLSGDVPVGNSLVQRTYLGKIYPNGTFEPATGAEDPYADRLDNEENPVELPGLPIKLTQCRRGIHNTLTVHFATGKTKSLILSSEHPYLVISRGPDAIELIRVDVKKSNFTWTILIDVKAESATESISHTHPAPPVLLGTLYPDGSTTPIR